MLNYIAKIRKKLGHDMFIHPAARILIENEEQQILFIKRTDNGNWGIPAGSLEENETIEACIKREVFEETGLTLKNLTVIGISSQPKRESVVYPNGDKIQYFTIEFYSNEWTGNLRINDPKEIKHVEFKEKSHLKELPPNEYSIVESWAYYQQEKKVMLK